MGTHLLQVRVAGKHLQHPPRCTPVCPVHLMAPKIAKMALDYGEYEILAEGHVADPVIVPVDL